MTKLGEARRRGEEEEGGREGDKNRGGKNSRIRAMWLASPYASSMTVVFVMFAVDGAMERLLFLV